MDKSIDNRLATIEGHIKAVRKMLGDEKNCVDVITQLMAIERAVKKTSVIILKDHLNHCVKDAISEGEEAAQETFNQFNKILEMYL